MNYPEAVEYIMKTPKFRENNEQGPSAQLIDRLGHPEEAFRILHVAGTNGKGSVCAFLESMLRHAGYRTGLYTSPHLVRINERFMIDRKNVDDEAFAEAFSRVRQVIDEMTADGLPHPTFFDILFATGLVIFQNAGIDVLVMETGLGGRMDATNSVAHTDVSVITSISLDHMEYLGDTVAKIAGEKAGIIKEGVPVIYDASDREAAEVIAGQAEKMRAPAFPFYPGMAQITQRGDDGIDFVLNNRQYEYLPVHVPFPADYQVSNASLALMALRVFDPEKRMDDRAAALAVSDTRWSGRMQQIMPGVILDGAHNEDGIRQLLKTVREIRKSRKVNLLFSVMADKDYSAMIRELALDGGFSSIVVTGAGTPRQADPEVLAGIFQKYTDAPVETVADPGEAFERALSLRAQDGMLFCAGSLYLAGYLLANKC